MVAVSTRRWDHAGHDQLIKPTPGYCYSGDAGKIGLYSCGARHAELIGSVLLRSGYCRQALNSEQQAQLQCYGAIVCHRKGQDVAAMELLRTIKATRIVVLSDCREESSIVSLLNSGAHHHFYIDESSTVLKNRIDAALRIHNTKTAQFLSIDDIQFDTHKRLVCRSGKRIDLSPKEYELAYYLFTNLDRTIGNGELMSAVWSLPSHMDSRRIDTAACRVRKKLGLSPCLGWELKRIRMVGYRLLRLQTIKRMQLV